VAGISKQFSPPASVALFPPESRFPFHDSEMDRDPPPLAFLELAGILEATNFSSPQFMALFFFLDAVVRSPVEGVLFKVGLFNLPFCQGSLPIFSDVSSSLPFFLG